jgi:hypothetical protein
MTAEDATALLKRMQLAYDPPRALRGRPEAIRERLRVYQNALEPFDAEVLDRAWLKAAASQRYPQWPDCPDIVEAAEHFHALAHPKPKVDDSWVERATSLADAYTRRFMKTSAVAVRARERGYESEVRQYVTEAAWVQGQMICGRKSIGYSSGVLFPGRERDKTAEDEFFARARDQAATGSIRVRIPLALVERWREGAEKGRGR